MAPGHGYPRGSWEDLIACGVHCHLIRQLQFAQMLSREIRRCHSNAPHKPTSTSCTRAGLDLILQKTGPNSITAIALRIDNHLPSPRRRLSSSCALPRASCLVPPATRLVDSAGSNRGRASCDNSRLERDNLLHIPRTSWPLPRWTTRILPF